MGLIAFVLVLAVVGVILYMIETYIPMAEPIKLVIRVVIVIAVVLYFLKVIGVADIAMPRL